MTALFDRVKTWVLEVDTLCSKGESPDANTGLELALALRTALAWAEAHLAPDQREALAVTVDAALRGVS